MCRVLESLIGVIGPLSEPVMDWKAYWPVERNFEVPNLKQIYNKLMYMKNWYAHLNKIWGKTRSERSWAGRVERIWSFKGPAYMKVFLWKILWGAIPTRNKVCVRGIGSVGLPNCFREPSPLIHGLPTS